MTTDFLSFSDRRGIDAVTGKPNIDRLSVSSLSPSLSAQLHPRVIFNSQFLFENGGAEASNTVTLQKGQAVVLQAYADWFENEKQNYGRLQQIFNVDNLASCIYYYKITAFEFTFVRKMVLIK